MREPARLREPADHKEVVPGVPTAERVKLWARVPEQLRLQGLADHRVEVLAAVTVTGGLVAEQVKPRAPVLQRPRPLALLPVERAKLRHPAGRRRAAGVAVAADPVAMVARTMAEAAIAVVPAGI
jgi:hypothetical protein